MRLTDGRRPARGRHRLALAVIAASLAGAAPAAELTPDDRAGLARIEDYLNSVTTLRAHFDQVAPDGALASGAFYLSRPGRLRFEYAPPTPILIVANRLWLIFHDTELGQVDRLPLYSTPLGFLVKDEIEFGGDIVVEAFQRLPGELRLTLRDEDNSDEGSIMLVFSDAPLRLWQWRLTDAQGLTTRITLSDVEVNVPLDAGLFNFDDPVPGGDTPRR